jgi:hypothetical protein
MSYLVVRHVPKSPVYGGTFGSYLDDPQIEVYSASASSTTLPLGSTTVNQSNLLLVGVPWVPGVYAASVSKTVEKGTPQSRGNHGSSPSLNDGNGVAFGSAVVYPNDPSSINTNTTVTDIPGASTLNLSKHLRRRILANTSLRRPDPEVFSNSRTSIYSHFSHGRSVGGLPWRTRQNAAASISSFRSIR